MPVKKRKLPQAHKQNEKAVFKLVSKLGISKTICINRLRLPANYFNAFEGTTSNFNAAMAKFTTNVLMKSVVSNLSMDSNNRKYIMQKTRVFDSELELPIKKMTSAKHASTNLSFALNAYSQKLIGEDSLMAIRQACSVFSDLMIATDIETRLSEIERKFNENA